MTALACASPGAILPAFAESLGAPNVVIGAIPAVMTLGWLLPSLFAAAHTESLGRKLPFILRWTVWERVPFLVLAGAAFALAEPAPGLTLAVTLSSLLVITGVGGLLMPAWMDVVGRAVPTTLRGRFFAGSSALGNVGGLLASLGATWILASVPGPAGFALCFLAAALLMALSFVALAATREPPAAPPARARRLGAHLARVPDLLRRDPDLSWFVAARCLGALGTLGAGFFTVHALRAHEAAPWQPGVFTAVTLAGQLGGNLALGWLADRSGHLPSVLVGVGAMALANVVALWAPTLAAFTLVFALVGIHQAAIHVSSQTIMLEFAPGPEERPTYVGLGNTAVAPPAVLGPLVAGLAADRVGLPAVFAVGAACGLAGLGLLARVADPRHRRQPARG
jgi:MFS family permease